MATRAHIPYASSTVAHPTYFMLKGYFIACHSPSSSRRKRIGVMIRCSSTIVTATSKRWATRASHDPARGVARSACAPIAARITMTADLPNFRACRSLDGASAARQTRAHLLASSPCITTRCARMKHISARTATLPRITSLTTMTLTTKTISTGQLLCSTCSSTSHRHLKMLTMYQVLHIPSSLLCYQLPQVSLPTSARHSS